MRGEEDATIIEADRWNQLLAGVDEATFSKRYGIDYEQLIEGGRQIATGNGELGEILFATGSSVMDLNAVKRGLTDEAEEIFKPQGKKQRLNLAIVKWQELKDLVRDKLLSVSAWEEADRLRQETVAQLDTVSLELARHTKDYDQNRQWQQAWPLVQEFDSIEHALFQPASVPRLDPDFGAKRQEAFLGLKQSHTYENTASEDLQRAELELENLVMPPALITRTDELSKLITDWGSCQKGLRDRLKLIEQRDRHSTAICERQTSLGHLINEPTETTVVLDRAYRTRLGILGRQQA